MSSIICATLLLTSLAAGETASVDSTQDNSWGQYPAYSSPPLVAAVTETRKEAPPATSVGGTSEPRAHFLAALIDAGVPDGAGVSIAVRPLRWLRVQAGATHNLISTGIRGGVSLIPFYYWISPSLTAEVGHYFSGDATWAVHLFAASANSALLKNVSYDYGNAQVGLELGSPRSVSFFLRGGITYLQTSVTNLDQAIHDSTIHANNLSVSGTFPSAKLGLIIYFL